MIQRYCPCGGIILADTEDWMIPMCNEHYESLGAPEKMPDAWVQAAMAREISPKEAALPCSINHHHYHPLCNICQEAKKNRPSKTVSEK